MQIPDIVRRLLAKASAAANPQPAAGARSWTGFVWTEELLRAKKVLDEAPVVLLTGEAGTGKSTFIREYRDTTKKSVVVVAPTGIAALNARGATIHSFFKLAPKPVNLEEVKRVPDRKLYEKLDMLIIDEVSMVRADLLDGIERFLSLNGPRPGQPFGGVQVVMVGDPFQLPPVVKTNAEAQLFGTRYPTAYFFGARCLAGLDVTPVVLTTPFRQADPAFLALLNALRRGELSSGDLAMLNGRLESPSEGVEGWVVLTPTNDLVDEHNTRALKSLPGPEQVYEGKLEGSFDRDEDRLPSPRDLRLREGAQVLFTKNDAEKRWVNGSVGIVKTLKPDAVVVKLVDGHSSARVVVEPVTWENVKFEFDPREEKVVAHVVGKFTQLPLTLGWARTIHKSQGQTLDRARIDLGRGAFAHGQLYVAVSRVKTFSGLRLAKPVSQGDVKCDALVRAFYEEIEVAAKVG